ncbi:hypothetical protein DDE82_006799 [Stemphylium lycopersici]|uniref:Uncharacterized protein n=1 Tax=Stemphylium lycopersici TaxID=183478 RepID=A0A364N563_STELY|nr:hypothetical protein TW65_97118 [Stemphylium lycopersici]RAR01009.1 hypothetical protein DDE82_006799 [Stemphylium lycopersici]RAR12176.1 hypothetical protein DDE83_004181 [Stemphylium lycopersici]
MPSYIPYLLALGALSTSVAADNIYTYTQGGCSGPAFMFKDIDHNICAVTITANASGIADAIARGITTVHSAKLEVQETGKKRFIGWDEGPDSNADGPLQCGTIVKNVHVKKRETCIQGSLHGVSWTEPGDNRKRQASDVYTCTGSTEPNAVFCEGKHYDMDKATPEDKKRLKELALNGGAVPADLAKYEFVPNM